MKDKAVMFDMDEARKEKFKRVSGKMVDILMTEMESPVEAYALIQFLKEAFEELYGIRAALLYGDDKVAHG